MRVKFIIEATIWLIIPMLVLSCESSEVQTKTLLQFKEGKSEFQIDSTISKESNTLQYFSEDETEYLVVFNKPTNEIVWFDFNKKKVLNRTKLLTDGPSNIGKPFGIHVKSRDSIFVLSSATYSLSLINDRGDLLRSYKLFEGELNFAGVPEDVENSVKPIMQSTNPLIILSDSVIALAGLPDANPLKPSFYTSNVYIKLNLNSGSIDYNIPYPKRYHNKIWGLYHSFPYHSFNESTGKAVISFPASKKLFQTDFVDIDSLSVASKFVEEPSSWKNAKADGLEMMKFFVSSPSFYRIIYDPNQNLYYRFSQSPAAIDFSKTDMSQFSIFNSKETYLSVLDADFKTLIEVELPKKYDPRFMFTTPKGLHIAQENKEEDKMTFGIFDFQHVL